MSVSLSTEDVVNRVAAKPSLKFLSIVVGIMSFQIMKAMVAYFPNLGGYVPYEEWRCEVGSMTCYDRVSVFKIQDYKSWLDNKMVELEDRCMITVSNIDTTHAKLNLHGHSGNDIGSIKIQSKSENLVISISSNSTCDDQKKELCEKEIKVENMNLDTLECTLQFAGTKTPEDRTTLTCNDVRFDLNSELDGREVYSLIDAVQTVRFISVEGVEEYQLTCPDLEQYNKKNLCGPSSGLKELVLNTDFHWHTKGRSSFAVDWNLHCGGEFLRSLLGSVFFGGALLGTFIGGNLFDMIGRKLGALVGYGIVTVSTLIAAFSPSIEFLFVCRFFQGAGVYIGSTGGFVLLLEYTASKYRLQANVGVQLAFGVGYLVNTFFAYFIKDWHWLVAVDGLLFVVAVIPLLLMPDSPRYFLVNKRDDEKAKESLKWLARINGSDFDIDTVILNDVELTAEKTQAPEPTFLEAMKDFMKYRELLVQLGIQMWLWLVAGFLYYGFSFSWSELGNNIYISYVFAAVGEIIAYLGMGFPFRYLGRRISIMIYYLVASGTFLLALIPLKLSSSFSLEQLSCLIGSMFVAATFCGIYLYTMELAPTSHRGKMLGYSSFAARIGSFCGPQASLLFSWNKPGTLVLFAVLAASAGLLCYRLPDTKDVPTPSTAAEVQRRKDEKDGRVQATVVENKSAAEFS